jgi:hypothetical protein
MADKEKWSHIVVAGAVCRLADRFQLKIADVGARDASSRRAVQREAGGKSHHAHLTCAAPATVSRRVFSQTKTQLSSQTTGRPETGRREGDEGRSVSPDTGQQGDLSQDWF